MALQANEKEQVRYHLGYTGTGDKAASLVGGIPTHHQTMFLLENAMTLLMPESEPRVRAILQILEGLECQMVSAQTNLAVRKLGELELREATAGETHTDLLEREHTRWAKRLADIFGVPLYQFSAKFGAKGTSGAGRVGNLRVKG